MNPKTLNIIGLISLLASIPLFLNAADYTWDPSTTSGIQYGDGIWDTSTANWTTNSGNSQATWNNSTGSTNNVSFPSGITGGAPAQVTVTLGADINLQQIGMGGSYGSTVIIAGNGYTLNFSGGSQYFSNNNTSKNLQIDAVIGTAGNISKVNNGTVILSQNNTYAGTTTIAGGTLQIGAGGTTGTLGTGAIINNATLQINRSNNYTITNAISGTGALVKTGAGTLTLSGQNTYTGQTTIWAGTIQLGGNERLADTAALRFGNSGTFATAGFSETLGTLTISNNAQSVIDFGNGTSALAFADSHSVVWSGTLKLVNFTVGVDSLRFGTSASALTADQLNAISLAGYTAAALDANGYVIFAAIPEPSTYALFLSGAIVLTVLYCRRKK